jgi:two-component system nitrate/nitrite response regulator NarL
MDAKIRLLLVDDHTLFREGLARLLEAESGLRMVGHYSSTDEALASSELGAAQVILLDFDLGETRGLEFIREARERGFAGKILMVTAGMSSADALQALKDGASGIFLKHNPPANLITAIHRVAAGETWIEANSLDSLLGSLPGAASGKAKPQTSSALGKREQAVLKGVFEGLTNKEIAVQLDISESYVKAVLQQLFAKTGVRTRSQLVRVALEKRVAYGGAPGPEAKPDSVI